jgi:hypothetical protein
MITGEFEGSSATKLFDFDESSGSGLS